MQGRQASAKSKLGEAIRYTLTRWEGLTRYLDDGLIDLDNNAVDRSSRPVALDRNYAKRRIMRRCRRRVQLSIELLGIDHVGISGDFDAGGGVAGLEDVGDYLKITAALRRKGFSADDIGKVWGGNMLRVLNETQALAATE